MGAIVLDGRRLAGEMSSALKHRVALIRNAGDGFSPVLATILVGDDPASATYVKMKGNACRRIGMESRQVFLSGDSTSEAVIDQIDALNADDRVRGILLQHPVPAQIDERACFDRIALEKDVDGVTCLGFGRMAMGEPVHGSATPAGIMGLLNHYKIPLEGRDAVVVGRSPILGKPIALMLLSAHATVTVCHSRTKNLPDHLRRADIVVGAVGRPEFIQAEWLREGAVVIDAGYNPGNVGDIDLTGADEKYAAYTPVPGGVGPMTIATLIEQTVVSAERFREGT